MNKILFSLFAERKSGCGDRFDERKREW